MKLLVKFPTRERPEKALRVLSGYIKNAANNKNIIYLVSYDDDDYMMNDYNVLKRFKELNTNVICIGGKSLNKVHAYNRDIEKIQDWDILIASSDDMICIKKIWDEIIRKSMDALFPKKDGVLHFNDGFTGIKLNTLPILSRNYYNRFNYVYNPLYKSLWCDNEFQEVSIKLNKQIYINTILFRHEHYCNIGGRADKLMKKTESFFNIDKATFNKRKQINFGLNGIK